MSVERRLGLMSQKNISKANWSHYGSIRPQATRVTTTVTMAASTAADVLRRRWCRLMVSVILERPDEARANADHHVAAITCRVRSPSRIGLGPILFLLYVTNLLNVTGCPSRLCRHSNLRLCFSFRSALSADLNVCHLRCTTYDEYALQKNSG